MQFENSHSEIECSGRCPECIGTTAPHCSHCSRYGKAAAVHLPNGCDYSYLVGDPAKQHEKGVHAVPATELLTDYDRILLGLGMHILWQL
jgi:hypothetical protein